MIFLELVHRQQQVQKQILSQVQRQSLEILQMPLADLQAYLQEQVLSNPLVELELPAEVALPQFQEPEAELPGEQDRWELADSESVAAWESARSSWEGSQDQAQEYLQQLPDLTAQQESLTDVLLEQLVRLPGLTDELRALCHYLAECLDQNGFLTFSLEDLAAEQGVPLFQMEQALYVLQALHPTGVGARSLQECLMLQLAQTGDFHQYTVKLIQQGLSLLAQGNLAAIRELLGCTAAQAKDAARVIRTLNPRPAQGYSNNSPTLYRIPEAVFRRVDGQLEIELKQHQLIRLVMSEETRSLLEHSDRPQDQDYLKTQTTHARTLMRCVDQRAGTIERILALIGQLQGGYFLRKEPLVPLTITQLADQLGLSLSTVSRAIQGKSILFEGRSIPLRSLFVTAVAAPDGRQLSSEHIRQQLALFIRAEDPRAPLSDEALRAALEAVHLPISRRTVAKYRDELGIPSSSQRRRTEE